MSTDDSNVENTALKDTLAKIVPEAWRSPLTWGLEHNPWIKPPTPQIISFLSPFCPRPQKVESCFTSLQFGRESREQEGDSLDSESEKRPELLKQASHLYNTSNKEASLPHPSPTHNPSAACLRPLLCFLPSNHTKTEEGAGHMTASGPDNIQRHTRDSTYPSSL